MCFTECGVFLQEVEAGTELAGVDIGFLDLDLDPSAGLEGVARVLVHTLDASEARCWGWVLEAVELCFGALKTRGERWGQIFTDAVNGLEVFLEDAFLSSPIGKLGDVTGALEQLE